MPGFWIDKYEVTNSQFLEFIKATGYSIHISQLPAGWSWALTPSGYQLYFPPEMANFPVVGVSFYWAQAYAKWRGKRLPTEWEWEKAARGVNPNEGYDWYPEFLADRKLLEEVNQKYGHDEFTLSLIFRIQAQFEAKWINPGKLMPIRIRPFDLSPYGCLDMIFNAREWTMGRFGYCSYLSNPLLQFPQEYVRVSRSEGASMNWKYGAGFLTFTGGWNIWKGTIRPPHPLNLEGLQQSSIGFRCAK